MKPEIEVLKALEAETSKMEKEAVEAKETKLASMLNYRRQEIKNVLAVATLWESDPPVEGKDPQEAFDDYIKATEYVAQAIKTLMENQTNMGGHQKHWEKGWAERQDWKE